MSELDVDCWHIGLPDGGLRKGDGMVAFTAVEINKAIPLVSTVLGFHEAMRNDTARASRVDVHFPKYRPKSLIPVLSWLAAKLGYDDAVVSWYLDKQQGPDSLRKLLESLGWKLDADRVGRTIRFRGRPPVGSELPEAAAFTARLGTHEARLMADYGVFSPDHVDDGTALLLDAALSHRPVDTVADIGIGYGTLAVGLTLNSVAKSAVGTDVDCVALWLAQENAGANEVPLLLACDADPTSVPPTPLTVCNVPTHINAEQTHRLMAGLAKRAQAGSLMVVVHASLEDRYVRHLASAGLHIDRVPGPAHVVLTAAMPGV